MADPVRHLKKVAKELARKFHEGDSKALELVRSVYRDGVHFGTMRAQHVVARMYGFGDWGEVCAAPVERVQAAITERQAER